MWNKAIENVEIQPDFNRVAMTLHHTEPDRVPLAEAAIHAASVCGQWNATTLHSARRLTVNTCQGSHLDSSFNPILACASTIRETAPSSVI